MQNKSEAIKFSRRKKHLVSTIKLLRQSTYCMHHLTWL
ncbi:hypothetical protein UUU_21700 [Klebsiella pneumoniae subsp. pneumoniae DSM 30104 = JCM 1662 = NBRC 14940]|nr:hypothetical protein UUU_21700 [Klebsiella pneumoniae subsp. pneumoniae DSM 30104 = JCM 1662 = NBRC 14940]